MTVTSSVRWQESIENQSEILFQHTNKKIDAVLFAFFFAFLSRLEIGFMSTKLLIWKATNEKKKSMFMSTRVSIESIDRNIHRDNIIHDDFFVDLFHSTDMIRENTC
jgi:hypothetical protein